MKGSRAAVVAIVAVVLIGGGWWLFSRGKSAAAIDLTTQLETAKRQPRPESFSIEEVEINGEKRRVINANPPTRLTFRVRGPDDAWLRVAVGMKPESFTQEGNGTYFFVAVSDGRTYDELFTQHVNPFANSGDRKWIPVWVDLSAYAGEEVDLILNTRTSPGREPDDPRHDLAMWGDPQIVVR